MPSANSSTNETLIKNLELARGILDGAIVSLKGSAGKPLTTKGVVITKSDPFGLPDHILKLRDEGYFKTAKNGREVHEKLASTYSCSVDRVAMALLRLQRKKMLRKTVKLSQKKQQLAYVW